MVDLVTFYWGWLVGSALYGFAFGWIAVVHRGNGVSKRTSLWLTGLLAALIALALAGLVPGRAGYWLDLGLVMIAAYVVGCAVGSWLRHWVISRQEQAA
ncbi:MULTISPECIES: hypothetical protein [Rhodopseudomonas]|uniref:Membrane protein n=1 Tax=Rhodopseudomonas palustris TaxID=1076 RepID=A0A0D7EG18_RHOPL|nr:MULTISPECIES: hypothetical protein [Rhodopseudomonas]KIZ39611.1 membrane protein [Rhodopseudomonas palustris]MDF3811379.1 hypothetical protein [Rhodopseudomonas sp. BAL398]WOK16120.1 hypothetical protein RBJ75_18350 [Rhodopseudomonas sp. BAL398]